MNEESRKVVERGTESTSPDYSIVVEKSSMAAPDKTEAQETTNTSTPRQLVKAKRPFNWRFVGKALICFVLSIPILGLGLFIFLSPSVGQPLYKKLIFHPYKFPDGDYTNAVVAGVKASDVYFKTSNGNLLHAWFFKVPNEKHVVLFSHGNGANLSVRRSIVAKFIKNHQSVFTYDYQGYGRSEGEPSIDGIVDDAYAAYNYLRNDLHYRPKQIILLGESLGTAVTGVISPTVESAAIILECPLYSLKRKGQELLPFIKAYPDWTWPHGGLDCSQSFAHHHAPLLIISGTADRMTPVSHADDLFAASSEPKTHIRIAGAGHGDDVMARAPEFEKGLHDFLLTLN